MSNSAGQIRQRNVPSNSPNQPAHVTPKSQESELARKARWCCCSWFSGGKTRESVVLHQNEERGRVDVATPVTIHVGETPERAGEEKRTQPVGVNKTRGHNVPRLSGEKTRVSFEKECRIISHFDVHGKLIARQEKHKNGVEKTIFICDKSPYCIQEEFPNAPEWRGVKKVTTWFNTPTDKTVTITQTLESGKEEIVHIHEKDGLCNDPNFDKYIQSHPNEFAVHQKIDLYTDPGRLNKLKLVNSLVNHSTYHPESVQKVILGWEKPENFVPSSEERIMADCKGVALLKRQRLIEEGVPPGALRILTMNRGENAEHVVLVARVEIQNKPHYIVMDETGEPLKYLLTEQPKTKRKNNDYLLLTSDDFLSLQSATEPRKWFVNFDLAMQSMV